MFLFLTLVLILIILIAITAIAIAIGGSVFIILFGDVIVCVFLIAWLIKKIFFNKKDKTN